MLPKKTYAVQDCALYESDFDVSNNVKLHRIMELLQNLATAHAADLGCGWDVLNANGLFWVLSKVKITFDRAITREESGFTLYTWPVAPVKFFAERRFEAVDGKGERLFSCSSLWMIVERDSRKIASSADLSRFYRADFDDALCGADSVYERIRRDGEYRHIYDKTVFRSDLDINRHVNNTNYVTYAMDVLETDESVSAAEIVYHKELKLGDVVSIYCKRSNGAAYIVGERNAEICFTAKLTLR